MKSIQERLGFVLAVALIVPSVWGASSAASLRPPRTTASPKPTAAKQFPKPAAAPLDRKIAPQDLLVITIVGETGLQTEFRVSASGTIQFPFLGIVKVAGLTPVEAKQRLEQLLAKDYFVDPQVIVTVKEYRPTYVRVIGAVARPGLIPLPGEQKFDVLDAIAYAGGITRYARKSVKYTHEGKTVTLDLEDLKKVTDPKKRIWVQPGDTIEVPERIF